MRRPLLFLALLLPVLPLLAFAEVRITPEIAEVRVPTADGSVVISRDQNGDATIDPAFSLTSRDCPPFCIQPMIPAPGVQSVGELELLEFLRDGAGLLIDARTDNWFLESTIPGSINIPYTEVATRLDELGCHREETHWECGDARPVVLFCNGSWCGQSPTAIRAMIREGYPAERIHYYRGGMQAWKSLGLTTVPGEF